MLLYDVTMVLLLAFIGFKATSMDVMFHSHGAGEGPHPPLQLESHGKAVGIADLFQDRLRK